MSNPETPRFANNLRVVFIAPVSRVVDELSPLLNQHLPQTQVSLLRSYPDRDQVAELLSAKSPTLCLLDTTADANRAFTLLGSLVKAGPNLSVVALLGSNDPDFILRCLRQGAADFMLQPFTGEQLQSTLSKMARLQPSANGDEKIAKTYCFIPAKGACGASTIACNFAYQWKRLGAKKILLADLDPLTGIVSFLLKIKSSYSFIDVLLRSGELDADLWKSVTTTSNGVDVLLAPETMAEGVNEFTDPTPIIEFARHNYDVAIADAASAYGEWNLALARLCDEVLLVTTNELPALQAAQRALSYLDANRIGRWKIRLVVNRYDREVGLNKDVIGQALHTDVYHLIPSDTESVQRALMDGRPIPAGSTFGRSMLALTDRLSGRDEPMKKNSSLTGLLSLFTRTSS
ncbi:MAG: hypothetical protein ABI165_07305 [Bryobacteraceae bacterium]